MKINSAATKTLSALAGLLLAGSLSGCDAAAQAGTVRGGPDTLAASPLKPGDAEAARVQLESLPVKGRAPKTGYARERFGPAWADVDHNGCDTRNDILQRDLTAETFKPGTHGCVVATGVLADKYTGKTINFVRGKDSSDVQIDHVIPLSDAWQKGAQQISEDQRKQFANDPLNLMAVDGPTNSSKSDKDAATWLPPRRASWCEYAVRQTAVKAKYKLWVTQAERDAIAGILASC